MAREYESDIQGRVLEWVRETAGWPYIKHNPGVGRCPKGFPDTEIYVPGGRPVFMELKRGGGRATPTQSLWHRRLRALGYSVYFVNSYEHAVRILQSKYKRAQHERRERDERAAGRTDGDGAGG